jgi:hypothetical protein
MLCFSLTGSCASVSSPTDSTFKPGSAGEQVRRNAGTSAGPIGLSSTPGSDSRATAAIGRHLSHGTAAYDGPPQRRGGDVAGEPPSKSPAPPRSPGAGCARRPLRPSPSTRLSSPQLPSIPTVPRPLRPTVPSKHQTSRCPTVPTTLPSAQRGARRGTWGSTDRAPTGQALEQSAVDAQILEIDLQWRV